MTSGMGVGLHGLSKYTGRNQGGPLQDSMARGRMSGRLLCVRVSHKVRLGHAKLRRCQLGEQSHRQTLFSLQPQVDASKKPADSLDERTELKLWIGRISTKTAPPLSGPEILKCFERYEARGGASARPRPDNAPCAEQLTRLKHTYVSGNRPYRDFATWRPVATRRVRRLSFTAGHTKSSGRTQSKLKSMGRQLSLYGCRALRFQGLQH